MSRDVLLLLIFLTGSLSTVGMRCPSPGKVFRLHLQRNCAGLAHSCDLRPLSLHTTANAPRTLSPSSRHLCCMNPW
jgi:hypothetical protein